MKYALAVIAILGLLCQTWAQQSDCEDAVPICSSFYEEDDSPAGTGQVFETAPGSCNLGEFNSSWYVFTVQETGYLSFVLDPNDVFDDYDWSLFDITDNGCGGISNGASPEVSCNSYGSFFVNGPTGISSANGGYGSSNGPGDINGPPFNEDLFVQAGDKLALVVMNFSATLNGYTLDFPPASVSIFDNIQPLVDAFIPNCTQTSFTFLLSEGVNSQLITPANISLSYNGQTYPVINITGVNGDYDDSFVINVPGLDDAVGQVTVSFANALTDGCGNPLTQTYSFELTGPPVLEYTSTPACFGENGGVEVTAQGLQGECFTFQSDGVPLQTQDCNSATGLLDAGVHNVTALSSLTNCSWPVQVTVQDVSPYLYAGDDQVLCDLNTQLHAESDPGVFQWLPQNGLVFDDLSDKDTRVSSVTGGPVSVGALLTVDDCEAFDQVLITFADPPVLDTLQSNESCFGECDGALVFINTMEAQSATLNGLTQSGSEMTFGQLCQGEYILDVVINETCSVQYDVFIDGHPAVVAGFDADKWVTDTENTEIVLTNTSLNADSVLWQSTAISPETSTDPVSWIIQLPANAGMYPVTITAFGEGGCSDSFTGNIIVERELTVFVPNAFSPNEDGINEVLLPVLSFEPSEYEFSVMNRWGDVIFHSAQWDEPWVGNHRNGGYYSPDGVYTWRLVVEGDDSETRILTGSVTLIR